MIPLQDRPLGGLAEIVYEKAPGHARLFCSRPCKACGTLKPDADYYTPGRILLLLWRYHDLVRLCGSGSGDTETQHLPRETPEGGHESGAAIKADLDCALMQLGAVERAIAWKYYVEGQPEVVIAATLRGANRYFVHRTRLSVLRKMAISLGWVPKRQAEDEEDLSRSAMRARLAQILEQAFDGLDGESLSGEAA